MANEAKPLQRGFVKPPLIARIAEHRMHQHDIFVKAERWGFHFGSAVGRPIENARKYPLNLWLLKQL